MFITTIVIIFILITIIDIPTKIQKKIYKKEYSEYVQKYSEIYNVDENLVYAVIKAESNFNSNAKSSKDAIGLMQLVESTAKDVSNKIEGDKLFLLAYNINPKFRFSYKMKKIFITLPKVNLEKHFIYYEVKLLDEIVNMIDK